MSGTSLGRKVAALIPVLALGLGGCETTAPTVAPTAASTPVPPATPSLTPTARPTPAPTTSGVVSVGVNEMPKLLDARAGSSGVWTGSEVLVWGGWHVSSQVDGVSKIRRSGAAYDPALDRWRRISSAPIRGRYLHLAAWTGREMLVWGGLADDLPRTETDGAAYNPETDRWRTIAPSPLPWSDGPTSVIADGEWVVAVTTGSEVRVATYNAEGDSWRLLPTLPGPISSENSLLWTGSELILMNNADGMYRLARGADAWVHSRSKPIGQQVAWTGTELIGLQGWWVGNGLVRHDVTADAWIEVPGPTVEGFGLIWTGSHALLLGETTLAFDPSRTKWLDVTWPTSRNVEWPVSVWTNQGLVEWGGWAGGDGGLPIDTGRVVTPRL